MLLALTTETPRSEDRLKKTAKDFEKFEAVCPSANGERLPLDRPGPGSLPRGMRPGRRSGRPPREGGGSGVVTARRTRLEKGRSGRRAALDEWSCGCPELMVPAVSGSRAA